MERIIHKIVEDFESIEFKTSDEEFDNYRLRYEYDSNTGNLCFFVLDNNQDECFFEMKGWSDDLAPHFINNVDTLKFFIKFFESGN